MSLDDRGRAGLGLYWHGSKVQDGRVSNAGPDRSRSVSCDRGATPPEGCSTSRSPIRQNTVPIMTPLSPRVQAMSLGPELPPPYSEVEPNPCRRRRRSSGPPAGLSSAVELSDDREAVSNDDESALVDDVVSVSSLDLLVGDDYTALPQRQLRLQRFRSTPQFSSSLEFSRYREAHAPRSSSYSAHGFSDMMPSFIRHKRRSIAEQTEAVEPLEPLPMAFEILLHSLRLFAAVPGVIGMLYLWSHAGREIRQGRWFRTTMTAATPGGLEYVVCSLWSLCTAFHALSLMTLLLRRWLIYYTVLPSVIRLVAFQSICWSLVRMSLWVFGPAQPIGGWVVVSTFTAFVDIVARWISSNIIAVDEEHEAPLLSDCPDTGASDDGLSPSLSQCTSPSRYTVEMRHRRYRDPRVRLFRAIMGGPSSVEMLDPSRSDEFSESRLEPSPHIVPSWHASGDFAHDMRDVDSDGASSEDDQHWRRRLLHRMDRRRRRRVQRRRNKNQRISAFFQNYHAARIHSRRIFHWDVAMWRNVMPIALLGYVTLWVFILGWSMEAYRGTYSIPRKS